MARRSSSCAGLAAGGLLLAHRLAYEVDAALHGPHPRHVEHGYLGVLTSLLLPACAAAFVWLVVSPEGRSVRLPPAAGLSGALVGAFVVQELAERMLSGVSVSDALGESVIWWGVLFQVLVAMVLLVTTRGGRAIARTLAKDDPPRAARLRLPVVRRRQPDAHPVQVSLGSLCRRGPPLLLA